MLFKYSVINQTGAEQAGTIDAVSEDSAITTLQRNGYVITRIESAEKKSGLKANITWFEGVSQKEIVILSRQLATLFGAQVSALRIFKMLGSEAENPVVRRVLTTIADDIQGGMPISKALANHPTVFSAFYCNMVLAGEETGRLEQTFDHLAEYLDRTYAVTSKAKNALVYPGFIIGTFCVVFWLMLTFVIPQLATLIESSPGADLPIYTRVVMGLSGVFKEYGVVLFGMLALGVVGVWRYVKSPGGRLYVDELKLGLPLFGELYRKLYLSRITDNMSTMLTSGIAMVQALEITGAVVENARYEKVIQQAREDLKNGSSIAQAFSSHPEIPTIMVQMIRVGEESGELSNILMTLSKFYSRELENTVDTITGLIEPIMIILLAGGVGVLLASVLLPIYSITTSIS